MKKDWEIKKLVDVCKLITCGVAKRPQYVEDGIPFLSAKNVKNGKVLFDDYKYITEETHIELTKNNKPLKRDILYTRVGSFGEAAVIEDDIEFSVFVSLTLIKIDDNILNQYFLQYYLNSDYVKRLAKSSISGSGVGNLNVGTVRNFQIPIPPLLEQKRIVSILDRAFEAIGKAKDNAEQNLKNAKELFESYLQDVFENKGNDWEKKTLGKVLISPPKNGWSPPAKYHSDVGVPVLTLSAVTGFIFKKESVKYTSAPVKRDAYYWLNEGDLLITRSNTPELVGHIAICEKLDDMTIYPDLMMKINPQKTIVNTRFLYYQLRSPKLRKIITASAHGANPTMKKINKQDVQDFDISYPPLQEQKQIVQKLDKLSAETKKLELVYQQKLEDLEELKKSVLQKVFNGEL